MTPSRDIWPMFIHDTILEEKFVSAMVNIWGVLMEIATSSNIVNHD